MGSGAAARGGAFVGRAAGLALLAGHAAPHLSERTAENRFRHVQTGLDPQARVQIAGWTAGCKTVSPQAPDYSRDSEACGKALATRPAGTATGRIWQSESR